MLLATISELGSIPCRTPCPTLGEVRLRLGQYSPESSWGRLFFRSVVQSLARVYSRLDHADCCLSQTFIPFAIFRNRCCNPCVGPITRENWSTIRASRKCASFRFCCRQAAVPSISVRTSACTRDSCPKRLGPNGQVHAVEPVPSTCKVLLRVCIDSGLKNVTVHNVAISDRERTVMMTVPQYERGGENYYEARVTDLSIR